MDFLFQRFKHCLSYATCRPLAWLWLLRLGIVGIVLTTGMAGRVHAQCQNVSVTVEGTISTLFYGKLIGVSGYETLEDPFIPGSEVLWGGHGKKWKERKLSGTLCLYVGWVCFGYATNTELEGVYSFVDSEAPSTYAKATRTWYNVGYMAPVSGCSGSIFDVEYSNKETDIYSNTPGHKGDHIVTTTLVTAKVDGVSGNPGGSGSLFANLEKPDSIEDAARRKGGVVPKGVSKQAFLYIEREKRAASADPLRFRKQKVNIKMKACDGISYTVTAKVIVTPINGFVDDQSLELNFGTPGAPETRVLQKNVTAVDGILEIEIPAGDGERVELVDEKVTLTAKGASSSGGSSGAMGSVSFTMQLGAAPGGDSAGFLKIDREEITADIFTPKALELIAFGNSTTAKKDSNENLRQLMASECLVDVVTLSATAYEVRFYETSRFAGVDPQSGLWTFSGEPFVVYAFQQGVDANEIVISEMRGASTTDMIFRQDGADWTGGFGKVGAGTPLQLETLSVVTEGNDRVETREIRNPSDNSLASKTVERIRVYEFGDKVIEEIEGDNLIRTVSQWYDNSSTDGLSLGQLKSRQRSDGYWETWEYDANGRRSKRVRQHLDTAFASADALNRVTTWAYEVVPDMDGDELDEELLVTVEYLLGQEVSRDYRLALSAEGGSGDEAWTEVREIVATQPQAAWDAPGNRVTVIRTGVRGDLSGRKLWRHSPDATVMRLELETLATGDLKWTTSEGVLLGDGSIVGRRTVVIETPLGREVGRDVYEDGVLMESSTVTQMDELGRPVVIDYSDGTQEAFSYTCCSLSGHIGRDGIATTYTYDSLKRRKTQTRAGVTETYSYDAAGRMTGTDVSGGGSVIALSRSGYDAAGRLLWEEDAMGRLTSHSYGMSSSHGEVHTTTFDADGSTIIETAHRDGSFYSRSGTATAPEIVTYGVGAGGERWVQRVAVGEGGSQAQWVREWTNMAGHVIRREYAGGASEHYGYDGFGRLVSQTDADGVRTLYAYNAKGERTVSAVDLNRNGIIDYGGADRITRTTRNAVQRAGVPVYRTTTEVWEADSANTPTTVSVSDVSANQRKMWNTAYGVTSAMETTYGASGASVQTVTNPDGSRTISSFDHGRLTSAVRKTAAGVTISEAHYTYDGLGRLHTQTIPGQQTITYAYYADGQQQRVTVTPLVGGLPAQVTSYLYDGRGRVSEITQPDGSKVYTTYHPTGAVKRTWGSGTYPVEYSYDPQGRMRTMTTWKDFSAQGGAVVTTWNYDAARGWLLDKRDANNHGPAYTYTPAGRLATRTWARGVVTTYGYSAAGDLASVAYSDSTPAVAHTYDRLGRPLVTTDAAGTLTRSYHNGALEGEVYTGTGLLAGKSVTRSFDALNRLSGLTAGSGYTVGYTYDDASRLASVSQGALTAEYAYHPQLGGVSAVTIKNAATERARLSRTFDALGRVSRIDTVGNGSALYARRDYTYDSLNRATRIEHEDSRRWAYGYDALGQVTLAEKRLGDDTTVQPGYAFGYAYDDIGNRTQASANGRTAAYASNALNQYTGRDYPGFIDVRGSANPGTPVLVNDILATRTADEFYAAVPVANETSARGVSLKIQAVDPAVGDGYVATVERSFFGTFNADPFIVPARSEAFEYDADGNLTRDGRWLYTWDGENRLLRVRMRDDVGAQSGIVRFGIDNTYDSQGRRVGYVESIFSSSIGWAPFIEKFFLYDGWNLLREDVEIGGHNRHFIWGTDISGSMQGAGGVGGLLWAMDGGQTHAAGYDANGNIIAWVNTADGTLSGIREYGAFGESVAATGVGMVDKLFGIPFGFSTKYQDRLTGHYYYGYRFYSTSTGRWLSRDPIEEQGGMNLYGFVGNNGVNQWDLLGMAEGAGCNCGPDVTVALRRTIQHIGSVFRSLPADRKDKVCGSFIGHASWDIYELKSKKFEGMCGVNDDGNMRTCRETVTIDGGCHYVGSVNYILYGRMFKLCDKWSLYRWLTIKLYKGMWNAAGNYGESQAWAKVGHRGWASAVEGGEPVINEDIEDMSTAGYMITPAADRKHCKPCDVKYNEIFKGQAGGMNW